MAVKIAEFPANVYRGEFGRGEIGRPMGDVSDTITRPDVIAPALAGDMTISRGGHDARRRRLKEHGVLAASSGFLFILLVVLGLGLTKLVELSLTRWLVVLGTTLVVFLAINLYVTKLFRQYQRIEAQAGIDPLTGLANRRLLSSEARECLRDARRVGRPLSVVMLDLDHFKDFNDAHGHRAGDLALRHLAFLIRNELRTTDMAARYGGEEFVLILSDTSKEDAVQVVERLRQAVERHPFRGHRGEDATVTVSAGLASWPEDGQRYKILIKAADDALYRAKLAGRNRVHLAS